VDWKPSDALTPDDFERHPLWGYDGGKAEQDPDSDETWVRPYVLDAAPGESDLLMARATLRDARNQVMDGAVLFVFEGGRPRIAGFAFLEPAWLAVGLEQGRVTDDDRDDLDVELPLAFEATVAVGGRELRLSGVAK
jgi:hypothetical protein